MACKVQPRGCVRERTGDGLASGCGLVCRSRLRSLTVLGRLAPCAMLIVERVFLLSRARRDHGAFRNSFTTHTCRYGHNALIALPYSCAVFADLS